MTWLFLVGSLAACGFGTLLGMKLAPVEVEEDKDAY